jgi:hypothetical protein
LSRIETKTYQISRLQLAYWSSFEYVRRFWPGFIAFPISGLVLFFTVAFPPIKALGMLMILWPISIPARSILITTKASKRAMLPTKLIAEGNHVYFVTEPATLNYRISVDTIRDVKTRVEYVVIELWKYRLVMVPYSAFSSPDEIKEFRIFCKLTD